MNFENLCQICQEKSAPYKCPKCQIKYCSLICYRDGLHKKCTKEFDENELIDSMNIDEDNCQNQTTTNNFVRERIDEILKRKLDEKDFHNENDDEQIEELFEHLLPSKDSETYRQVTNILIICLLLLSFYFYRNQLILMMRMTMKVKVKNVFVVMKNLYQIYLMILMNPMRI
jgi:hypothetical protein